MVRRRISWLLLTLAWVTVLSLAVEARTRVESAIIDYCTSSDLWRIERGRLVVDNETSASRGSSLRCVESGVYERVRAVEPCLSFSCLVLPKAERPVKLVGHLRDRDGAHYILETRHVQPSKNWTSVEFTLQSPTLAPWSVDWNHHLDFPLHSIGLMVTSASGESINIDRLSVTRAVGPTDEELILRERTRFWSQNLAARRPHEFREVLPPLEPVIASREEGGWTVRAPYYQASFDPHSGAPRQLEFGPQGAQALPLDLAQPWAAISWEGRELLPGPVASWEWEPKMKYLSVRYASANGLSGELRCCFRRQSFEMQLRVHNQTDHVIRWVRFPGRMDIPLAMVESVIWPRLGGVELLSGFFEQGRRSRAAYPADGFSDFAAFRMKGRTLALGTVQASPFFQSAEPVIQGDPEAGTVAYVHDIAAFIPPGSSWTLSPVLVYLTRGPEDALDLYRQANGWDRAPDLRRKLGSDLFERMSQSPLLKWDFEALSRHFRSGKNTFTDAGNWVQALEKRFLIHPVSYWNPPGKGPHPGKIFDQNHPNFLPGADQFGGEVCFQQFIKRTRAIGSPVAPYINPTAWGRYAVGFEDYGEDIAILSETGRPHWGWEMFSADPYNPKVQQKLAELVTQFTGSHYVDLLFEDQVGARPNYLNLREATPHPLAYTEGWIEHAREVSGKLPLMTERGFDALIPYEAGFCGVELGLACSRYMKGWEWNGAYGQGDWRVFPLEVYLSHDKCALYHHDLGQFVLSDYDLAWCLVKGYNLQIHYPGEERWMNICQAFQETVGPYMLGEPLRSFQYLNDHVVQSRFPRLKVVANFDADSDWDVEGSHGIPPNGVIAVCEGGRLRAGVVNRFHGVAYSERRYVIENHYGTSLVFRDILPSGETYRLPRHLQWPRQQRVEGTAVTKQGSFPLPVRETDDYFEFTYPASLDGEPVLRAEFRAEPRSYRF